ncbi:integrase core domain-containing protein [Streptomyces sp. NPDC048473]|uniref:integrase core domain-containing protein n=1 Tax=unclassified Streptomyces TaxID=2593676 RepID=UPI0037204779
MGEGRGQGRAARGRWGLGEGRRDRGLATAITASNTARRRSPTSVAKPDPPVHGAVGTSADNAAAESFFASLKREILPGRCGWPSERAARLTAFRRLGFYNHKRKHSTIGCLAPVTFEQRSTTLTIAA